MAAFNLAPGAFGAGAQFFGAVGANFPPNLPLNGGIVNTFAAGTSTPLATYTSNLGNIANPTSIVLGADGRLPGEIWFPSGVAYKFQLTDSTGFQIQTWDNLVGVNDSSTLTTSEWIASGFVPTYSSATTFTTAGNSTTTFQVGRRVKATVTAGFVYGNVLTSTFAISTTVVLTMDTGMALDNGLNQIQVSLLGESNPSVPSIVNYPFTFGGNPDNLIKTNAVAFHAHNSGNQTSGTTIIFDTIDKQTGGSNYSGGTGIFTAPVTGWYAFSASPFIDNTGGGATNWVVLINANATDVGHLQLQIPATTTISFPISVVTFLSSGQTAFIQATTFTASVFLTNAVSGSQFSGCLLARTA